MSRIDLDVDPCDHITADAIGKPGQRVFYLHAFQDQRTHTVIIEKAQLISLAIGVEQFLAQLSQQYPDLEEASGDYIEDVMRINPPVDPLFRAGEIGLGYDKDRDRVVVFVKELLGEDAEPDSASRSASGQRAPNCADLPVGDRKSLSAGVPFARNAVNPWNRADTSAPRRMGICIEQLSVRSEKWLQI